MKIFFLRIWAVWRRFQRGALKHHTDHSQYMPQVESLMRRADPSASWNERSNWMIDVADWIRRESKVSLLEAGEWRHIKLERIRFLLDWLDEHREQRRAVQGAIQKTLREATGPELFSATGLPLAPAFFTELSERMVRRVLPRPPEQHDLSTLFTAMFPEQSDADWLLEIDQATAARTWRLCADDNITHGYRQQIDEALLYLVTMVVATGISAAFRQRLGPRIPLQATPFMALRRELESYLKAGPQDDNALRSVRMLIAVCSAQTDRIYSHLDEYGVSVGLVYDVERMRAQLARMSRLIELRTPAGSRGTANVQAALADLITAHHRRSSVRALVRRSFSLLARKMVDRNADHGEHYIARNRSQYRAMVKAAIWGGVVTAFAALGKLALGGAGLASFFEGAAVSLNFMVSFMLITALGGVLATKQPAVTAPALAARMGALDTVEGLRDLLVEIAALLRSQAAAVFGNLLAVVPTMALVVLGVHLALQAPLMSAPKAAASLHSLSAIGVTPLFAALTGVLLWLSGLTAGFADNWFALRRLRESLAQHRRLVHALGAARAERWARWLERNLASIAGNVSLAVFLGMTPVVAQFFGVPLELRHVTLSAATLTAAAGSIGMPVLSMPEFWLAVAGIIAIGLLNVGVAFSCALGLALRAREVPARVRRLVFRAVLRRFTASPLAFLFPPGQDPADTIGEETRVDVAATLEAMDDEPDEPVSKRH